MRPQQLFKRAPKVTWHRCQHCNSLSDLMSTKGQDCLTKCSAERGHFTIGDMKRLHAMRKAL